MNIIELHILQSYPVSCLNRDDLGAPKSATFGGCTRARLSSQCLKRAHRELFKELTPQFAQGVRTKLLVSAFSDIMAKRGKLLELHPDLAIDLAAVWSTLESADSKTGKSKKGKASSEIERKMTTLAFVSPAEMDAMVEAAVLFYEGKKKGKGGNLEDINSKDTLASVSKAAAKDVKLMDAADIALFGRMVAGQNSDLCIEGAAMFSHALSTHRAEPEMDFYSAIDDLQPSDESGAGMTGVLEFSSACYYRYIAINLDLLKENLKGVDDEEIKEILTAFIKSALESVPAARKNSMNAFTRPGFVMGMRRSSTQPIQLVNAFETPVRSKDGYLQASVDKLREEWKNISEKWGLAADCIVEMPAVSESEFIKKLLEG